MKVDLTQFMYYSTLLRESEGQYYDSCYKELDEQIRNLVSKIHYVGPHGRLEFDTKDFYPKFDQICNDYRDKTSYCFVAAVIKIVGKTLGMAIDVAENGWEIERKYGKKDANEKA